MIQQDLEIAIDYARRDLGERGHPLPDPKYVNALIARGVRVVPADAVVVTEEALARALQAFCFFSDAEAAAILAALREGER